jgi:hypothetical protein
MTNEPELLVAPPSERFGAQRPSLPARMAMWKFEHDRGVRFVLTENGIAVRPGAPVAEHERRRLLLMLAELVQILMERTC